MGTTQPEVSQQEIREVIESLKDSPIKGFVLYEGMDWEQWRGPVPETTCRACHLETLEIILGEMAEDGEESAQLDWLRNTIEASEWIAEASEAGVFNPEEMALCCGSCGEPFDD